MAKEGQSGRMESESEQRLDASDNATDGQQIENGSDTAADKAELLNSIEELQKALDEAKTRAEENWNRFLRAQAELENHRKRSKREIENAHKYAIEKLVVGLLPVYDSLELGLGHSGEEADARKLHEGIGADTEDVYPAHGKISTSCRLILSIRPLIRSCIKR